MTDPFPIAAKETWKGIGTKLAVRAMLPVTVIVRVAPVPEPSPFQLLKIQPEAGFAVAVTTSPLWYGPFELRLTVPLADGDTDKEIE